MLSIAEAARLTRLLASSANFKRRGDGDVVISSIVSFSQLSAFYLGAKALCSILCILNAVIYSDAGKKV